MTLIFLSHFRFHGDRSAVGQAGFTHQTPPIVVVIVLHEVGSRGGQTLLILLQHIGHGLHMNKVCDVRPGGDTFLVRQHARLPHQTPGLVVLVLGEDCGAGPGRLAGNSPTQEAVQQYIDHTALFWCTTDKVEAEESL